MTAKTAQRRGVSLLSRPIMILLAFTLLTICDQSAARAAARKVEGSTQKPAISVTSISQAPIGKWKSWTITFSAAKPLHKVVRGAGVIDLYLSGTACPALNSVHVESIVRSSPNGAAYMSCSQVGSSALLQFRGGPNLPIFLAPNSTSLKISVGQASTPVSVWRVAPRGTVLGRNFFTSDALQRTTEAEQVYQRQTLNLLIATNRGTAIARSAQAKLTALPRPPKPILLSSEPFVMKRNGVATSAIRVEFIGRGGNQADATALTRIYYFVYNPSNGSVLMSGDSVAPNQLAAEHGLPSNNIAGIK